MKKNIDEIKEKISDINRMNNIKHTKNNNNNEYDNNINTKNKLLESINSSDLMSKGTSKIRKEKYEEINRLGEKLYQKLCEKEQKLRLLIEKKAEII